MFGASKTNSASTGGPADPYFYDVTMLLTGNGTNGAQNNTFLDSSSNAFSITRNGNTTQGSFSPYGSLWSNWFNGSTDYLSVANNANLKLSTSTAWTIETFFYTNGGAGTDRYIVIQSNSSGAGDSMLNYLLRVRSDTNCLRFLWVSGSSASALDGSTVVTTDTWHHAAVTFDGTNVRMYLDGVYQAGSSFTSVNTQTATTWLMGGLNATPQGSQYTKGYLSNFRYVNNTALYTGTGNFTPPTTSLTAVSGTQLLTAQSNRFIDNSSNAFTVSPSGTPSVQRFSPFNPTASYSTATIGGSGYFDGSGDYLQSADGSAFALGTGDFTLECWVYPLSLSAGYKYVFNNLSPSGSGNTEWAIAIATATPVFESYNTGYLSSSTNLNLNTWNHIAVSRSGSTLSMFLNGVRTATASNSNNFSASNGARVGAYGNGSSYFTGYVTDARAVKGAAVYSPSSSTITVPTSPLTAISNTSILYNMTNAGIPDSAMMNDLETVGNAQVSTSVKKFGTGSLYFDGTGDGLLESSSSLMNLGTGDFTVEGWVYCNSKTNDAPPLVANYKSSWASGAVIFRIYQNFFGGIPMLQCYDYSSAGYGIVTGTTNLSTNTWYYLAFTRSGNTFRLFVNGTLESTGTFTGNIDLSQSGTSVGMCLYDGTHGYLNGYIDDLRITKGYARYTSNFTPPSTAFPTY